VVATPNRHHADLGVALLEAGIHVLVEKPIAATVADAQRMIDAGKANNRVLMVGQVERFNPAVEAVKRAIEGEDVISIQITRVGPFPPRMGEVGVVIDLAVHDIDIIRHLTESEIVEVQPQLARTKADREDTALLQFRLANGTIAHITTNWVTPYKVRTLQVATQNKFVVADLMSRQVTEYFGQQPDGSYSTRGVMSWPAEPLKKELEQNEKRTMALSGERAALEASLSQPATPAAMADAGRKLKAVNDEIDALEARWLELNERMESIGPD
jgi:predicted dehydrogenase